MAKDDRPPPENYQKLRMHHLSFEIRKGEQQPNAKTTDDEVRAIRADAAAGMNNGELAAKYNLERSHISRIVRRTVWRHIT